MTFFEALDSEFGVACLAFLGAILSVVVGSVISNYHSKKIKFFETYFEKKATAYERLLESLTIEALLSNTILNSQGKLFVAKMYASDETLTALNDLVNITFEVQENYDLQDEPIEIEFAVRYQDACNIATEYIRKEIQQCRKFKFD